MVQDAAAAAAEERDAVTSAAGARDDISSTRRSDTNQHTRYEAFDVALETHEVSDDNGNDVTASCHNPAHRHRPDDLEQPPAAAHHRYHPRPPQHLRLVPLAILVFYNVSGGPFGIEATVRAGGNFFAIMGFLILPFVWSVPEALVTAELGSAFPEASGTVAWVEEAFGHNAGLIAGYLSWVAGATDNAIYPVLFLEYVTSTLSTTTDVVEKEMHDLHRFLIVSATALILAGINFTGLEIVGTASVVVAIVAMSPFVIMCILGVPKIDPTKWLETPDPNETAAELFDDDAELLPGPLPLMGLGGVFWRGFTNNLFWNLNSFDSAASFAGEVREVSTTYPRGIFLGTFLVVVCYLFPLLVATGATDSEQNEWVDGHMATVAVQIAGPWLGGWVLFSAGVSNLALFEAEMSADAWQLMGMSERGYLPKIISTRSRFGTPTYGILIGTLVIVFMSVADFSQLVEMLNFNYAISLLIEYAAFVKLRYTRRDGKVPVLICLVFCPLEEVCCQGKPLLRLFSHTIVHNLS